MATRLLHWSRSSPIPAGCSSRAAKEMAEPSPLLEHWISAYVSGRPLLDVGCAYGRNVAAAAKRVAERSGREEGAVEAGEGWVTGGAQGGW